MSAKLAAGQVPAPASAELRALLLLLAQVLVDEGDRHAALADRRGDALDRAEADVAAREDAGDARLEQVGVALELQRPAARTSVPVST